MAPQYLLRTQHLVPFFHCKSEAEEQEEEHTQFCLSWLSDLHETASHLLKAYQHKSAEAASTLETISTILEVIRQQELQPSKAIQEIVKLLSKQDATHSHKNNRSRSRSRSHTHTRSCSHVLVRVLVRDLKLDFSLNHGLDQAHLAS
eukprot:TRINITY_DN1398_c0_g2_i2.p1 TRINITY_DN1398_c0_g2~~TRINITY_DN1398_c0_g2_i2.p1  ORF type:complete len:147 (-),score=24.72 TRINITY_DN1398_c0_g2_i2:313-753(-)